MRRVVCVSPELLQKTGVPEHPSALAALPCVRISGPVFGDSWNFHENGKRFSVPVSGRLKCNQIAAAVDACASGIGFGVFFGYQAAPLIAQEKLQVVLSPYEPPPTPVSLVFPHAKLIATRTRVFLDWMAPRLRAALDQISV
jgi:DNA-binding transcriptional LysR family regulator